MKKHLKIAAACALALSGLATHAADWSDTSIGIATGSSFREPTNPSNIGKTIFNVTHVDGYKYGTNFLNLDLLQSNSVDAKGAQEAYFVYRNTMDYSKLSGNKFAMGPLRDVGVTFGFDWNTKNDFYASRKRMFVVGPTAMFDVPGFLNVSVLLLNESNEPSFINSRYTYKTHPELDLGWGIPIGSTGLSFEGFGDIIAPKGIDESGNQTATETHVVGKLMYTIDDKKTFKVGLAYEYWNNKFGNNNANPFFAGGAKATTPMLRAEYHF